MKVSVWVEESSAADALPAIEAIAATNKGRKVRRRVKHMSGEDDRPF
ncbi:MAG: hypothetical protein M3R37_01925 [Actinomycetota bacterium]|nr:hypothetical protein [Actinomycetota bacterium]